MEKSVDNLEKFLNVIEELQGLEEKTKENKGKLINKSDQNYKSGSDSNSYIRQWIIEGILSRPWYKSSV